jgi:two-component system, OmpR family, phosphate regulon sensor histidine kinase PhoR
MRARASIIGQLLIVFAVCAGLTGIAAIFGYTGVTRQDATAKQLTGQDYLLQHEAGLMQVEFDVAQVAVNGYALSGRRSDLVPLRSQETGYAANVAALRATAATSLQRFVTDQQQAGARLFAVAGQVARLPPRSAAAQALAAGLPPVAGRFYQANYEFQEHVGRQFGQLTDNSAHALRTGLAWSAAALGIALLLVLAASLSTVWTITRPLQALTATLRRLTAGDRSVRAAVTGSAEVREVARSVNAQADEADRLRGQQAEYNRLRAVARDAGLRIREHLAAADVLSEAQAVVQRNLQADFVYLRLAGDGRLAGRVGHDFPETVTAYDVVLRVRDGTLGRLRDLFLAQTSLVIRDLQGAEGEKLATLYSPELLEITRQAGVHSLLVTPFGVGSELLGTIVAQRIHAGHAWTPAEVDAVESIAADLGRGLNHARLYEAENRLVGDLKALDAAKSDFFATVSHELRSPLTTIEGYLEMLDEDDADPLTPRQRTMLATIGRSATRLHNLVDDVFTLAKLESSAFRAEMRPLRVADLVAGAVEAVRPSAAAAKLRLTCPPPAADLIVSGNPGQLERVLINLLSNAVKFTPAPGEVEVDAAADDGLAVIRVRDTGIGIPEHDQKELFTRFYRASNAIARRIPGTGLGLTIVATIVTGHGGELSLESQEGEGTTVTVRLPLHGPEPAGGPGASTPLQRQARLQEGQAALEPVAEPGQVTGLVEPGGHRDTDDGPGERPDREVAPVLPGPLRHRLRDDLGGPGELRQHPGLDGGHRDGHVHGFPQLGKLRRAHAVEGRVDRGAQRRDRPHVGRLAQEHVHPEQFHVVLQDDIFLGGEIPEKRARGHLGGLGDLLHRGGVVPLRPDKPERVLPDGSTRSGLLALPQGGPGRGVRQHAHGEILPLRCPGR